MTLSGLRLLGNSVVVCFLFVVSSKLELLKAMAPGVTRVAVLRDAETAAGIGQFAALQAVASPFKVELSPIDVYDAGEIERGLAAFAREPNAASVRCCRSCRCPLVRSSRKTLGSSLFRTE